MGETGPLEETEQTEEVVTELPEEEEQARV